MGVVKCDRVGGAARGGGWRGVVSLCESVPLTSLFLFPLQVSLDSRVREVINRNMVDPTPHTFDEAQLQIYTLMHRDSYPRFLNSQIYKRLIPQ